MFYSLVQKCPVLMEPLIECEYPLGDAQKAHVDVIEHVNGSFGRILLNPNLCTVCWKQTKLQLHLFTISNKWGDFCKGLFDVRIRFRSGHHNFPRHENQ